MRCKNKSKNIQRVGPGGAVHIESLTQVAEQ